MLFPAFWGFFMFAWVDTFHLSWRVSDMTSLTAPSTQAGCSGLQWLSLRAVQHWPQCGLWHRGGSFGSEYSCAFKCAYGIHDLSFHSVWGRVAWGWADALIMILIDHETSVSDTAGQSLSITCGLLGCLHTTVLETCEGRTLFRPIGEINFACPV